MIELIGYLASALIVLSFAMKSVVRLRIVSFIGCIAFVIYGSLIGAIPVVISNAIIAVLNAWYLYQEFTKKSLSMVPIETQAPFLTDFLSANLDGISRTQPDFELTEGAKAWLLNRDGLPAGAFIGTQDGDTFQVDLDFVTPAYRDSRLGEFVYSSKELRKLGVKTLLTHPGSPVHTRYLEKLGFVRSGEWMTRQVG